MAMPMAMAIPVGRVTAMAMVMATGKAKKGGQFVFSLGELF